MDCSQILDGKLPHEVLLNEKVGEIKAQIIERRFGAEYPGLSPGAFSAVPAGLVVGRCAPRTPSWATLSRPYGTQFGEL
jgi:hypothetical protein